MNRMVLAHSLREAESVRRTVYDDKTGVTLKPGTMLIGVPTVGCGRNLLKPMSDAAIDLLLAEDINEALATLDHLCPWWGDLAEPRQRALAELAFQLGETRLRQFDPTLKLIEAGNYAEAAQHLRHSLLGQQCPSRVKRVSELLRTGQDARA